MTLRIAVVAEGNADTPDCWSGCGQRFVEALRAIGARVDVYDANPVSWRRMMAAAASFHPRRSTWSQRYGLGSTTFAARSARASELLESAAEPYHVIVQAGATFAVNRRARKGARYVLYCDANVALARRGAPFSSASRLAPAVLSSVMRRERTVYDEADKIWTMSDMLGQSFRDDFEQPATKLLTIYAGVNNPPAVSPAKGTCPSILFVGKDHARKGSAVLLAAFDRVRSKIPDAQLHMVGGVPPNANRPGVHAHGVVTRATAAGRATLDTLFSTATVFCMPSRYEPFGVVFAEAMLAGLPCIGTTQWAMPEIIADGETGWLVPDGSVDALVVALSAALSDPARSARMGERGRERTRALFTWERVAERAVNDIEHLLTGATPVGNPHAPR